MEENELDDWFDEEKEKLEKDYFKKLKKIRIPTQEDDEESSDDEKNKKNKIIDPIEEEENIEKDFLAASNKLRTTYKKKYDDIVTKKELKKNKEKVQYIIFRPFIFCYKIFMIIFKPIYFFIKKNLIISLFFTKKTSIKEWKNIKHKSDITYSFKIKPKTNSFMWPIKNFFVSKYRPIKKGFAQLKEKIKDLEKRLLEILKKQLVETLTKLKKMLVFVKKYCDVVSAFFEKISKKMGEFKKAYIQPILDWLESLKKKDSGGDEDE